MLGKHNAWDASVRNVGKEKVCYISSLPKKSSGKYKKRGEASVIIAHWPKRKRWGEITINAGYRYKKKSEVLVRIGGVDHRLFTDGQQAFAYQNEDRKLLRAMRAGAQMAIGGSFSARDQDRRCLFPERVLRRAQGDRRRMPRQGEETHRQTKTPPAPQTLGH